ncbi:MAG TPA: DUF1684 domain-containing protein [Gemmatimonadales bacterium]
MIRFLPLLLFASSVGAQVPPDIAMERSGYVAWLKKAPNSPLLAVAQQRVGDGVRLGPADADIPLPGVEAHRVYPAGSGLVLEGSGGQRPIGRGRPYRIGKYALYLSGPPPGTVLTVFSDKATREPPGYYEYNSSMVFTGPLLRPAAPRQIRVLAADGIEVDATEVGSFVVPQGGGTPLRVLRIPIAGGDESDLEIFFRDESNGDGTYPAGRFVSLVPLPNGQFRLDFNRARNPFCAYSSVYPCPAPWRGNSVPAALRVGERYAGGGLEAVPAQEPAE